MSKKYKRRRKIKDGKNKRRRKYLVDVEKCIHLNERFEGCSAHHINKNIIIFIPVELHRHVVHNMRSGKGMSIINILAFQYLYGGLDGDFFTSEEIEDLFGYTVI